MKIFILALALLGSQPVIAAEEPPETVENVDLDRYLGTWFEIASIPQKFQEGCKHSQAEYLKSRLGFFWVINSCVREDNTRRRAYGVAWVVDHETNAKLKVSFFPGTSGNYWILDLDEDYQWAVVGDPTRKYLWILSRDRRLDPGLYDELIERIGVQHGYDTSLIEKSEP